MSLALNSCRIISHASIIRGAPDVPVEAWRLGQTALRPQIRNTFSTLAQRQAPEAWRVPKNLEVYRMRQQWRIRQKGAQLGYRPGCQQKPRYIDASTHRARQSGQSDWKGVLFRGVLHCLFTYFYYLVFQYSIRFVRTIERAWVLRWLSLRFRLATEHGSKESSSS